MATAKKRINITIDDPTYRLLEKLSETRNQSISGVGLELIDQALEYQEDLHFSRIADKRLAKNEKRLPHDKVWK